MKSIKFSHDYPKLHGQKTARLIGVLTVTPDELHRQFIEYDTVNKEGGHYKLPKAEKFLILLFLGDKNILFTTIRRMTAEKLAYYLNQVDMEFEIKIEEKNDKGRT